MNDIANALPDLKSLPNDVPALQSIIEKLSELVKTVHETSTGKDATIERLRQQLYLAVKHRYGRKSEQIHDGQLSIFLQEIEAKLGQLNTSKLPDETQTVTYTRKKGHGRNKLPENLPILREEYPLSDNQKTCVECQKPLTRMGEDVRNTIEHIPAITYIRQDILEKWVCSCCQGAPVTSEAPLRPIERCIAGAGLLAQVVTAKYADHLPLYRQAQIYQRSGFEVNRSTLCGWVGGVALLLEPLYEAMKQDVLNSKVIHTDDTPVLYLPEVPHIKASLPEAHKENEEDRRGRQALTGRLWTYVGDKDHANIVYDFSENRKGEHPKNFLGNWKGYLQCDAYTGYDGVFKRHPVREVSCWAHARRRFEESKDSDKDRALKAMAFIRKLYEVEWEAKEQGLDSSGIKALRQEKSKPILKEFKEWLDLQAMVSLPKSPFGEALTYVFNQWKSLNVYIEDGDLNIDNNVAERAMRCAAIGRKNWIFLGNPMGGRWAAIFYSLVSSCKHHKIDPYFYLRDVISRVKTHPMSRIRELLPATYIPGPAPQIPVFQKSQPDTTLKAPTTLSRC